MELKEQLYLGFNRQLTVVRQTEASECGIACLTMVADWHGLRQDLYSMRQFCDVSKNGMTLTTLMDTAQKLNLRPRALHVDIDELDKLDTPTILHWDMNHFVVLAKVKKNRYIIHDPAQGRVVLSRSEISDHFTGVALELIPNQEFEKYDNRRKIKLSSLVGKTVGFKGALAKIFVFALALELLIIMGPLINQLVIDEVLVGMDENLLTLIIIGLLLLVFTQMIVGMAREWSTIHLSVNFNMHWTANIFSHLVRLPIDWFEKRELGDISAKFDSINVIQYTITENIVEAILDSIIVVLTLTVMFLYSPMLTVVSLITTALYVVMRLVWFGSFKRAEENIWVANAKESSHFLETVTGILSVRVNGGTSLRENAWLNLNVKRRNAQLHERKLTMIYGLMDQSLMGISVAVVTYLGAQLVLQSVFTIGMFMAFISFQARFSSSVFSLINKLFDYKMLVVHTERLADIVLTKQETQDQKQRVAISKESMTDQVTVLEFEKVSFSYSKNEKNIVTDLSFCVKKNEIVALVGRSGCGKTTIAKLALGLYQPKQGHVRLYDQNLSNTDLQSLRQSVGTVFQDDRLFNGSILQNITFFSQTPDLPWAEECARRANIYDEVVKMPMGFHSLVGELGSTLSGGQKQRLLLARALYKNPTLLILDEATSHLDIENERCVNETMRDLGITIFQIAHRPETIALADRVIEL
ncbi:peptidase domain-containing ABC transporter [Vibrio maritimus]